MKSKIIIISIVLILIIIILSGPRVTVKKEIKPIILPDNLERLETSIIEQERAKSNILKGTEKEIVWFDKKEKTEYTIIYLHGFTASRKEISPICEHLTERYKANIFYTRLTAHGLDTGEEFAHVTTGDWLRDTYEALEIGKKIGDKLIIVATSMGASLFMNVYEKYQTDIHSVILVSPNFGLADKRISLVRLAWGKQIARLLMGKYWKGKPENDEHAYYWTIDYRTEGVLPMVALVNKCKKKRYRDYTYPTLLIYTENDNVVAPALIKKLFNKLASPNKKLININSKKHVLAGNIRSPENTEKAIEVITSFLDSLIP